MTDSSFRKILIGITILGVLVTAALTIITILLYKNISIISFIANGR